MLNGRLCSSDRLTSANIGELFFEGFDDFSSDCRYYLVHVYTIQKEEDVCLLELASRVEEEEEEEEVAGGGGRRASIKGDSFLRF